MAQTSAMLGTFVAIKTNEASAIPFVRRTANERVDGTLTVKIDIEPMYKLQFLQMFPDIGAAGALAALIKGLPIAQPHGSVSPPGSAKEKPGPLCVLACQFCADPVFRRWLVLGDVEVTTCSEFDAKEIILDRCEIDSRKELDTDERAARLFHKLIREPFMVWRDGHPGRSA